MAISRGPKLVTNGLVLALDASDDNSFAAQNLPIKNGLLLWLDAADDNSFIYSSGTEVSQWRDKSGNNFHANQATVGQQPSRSSVINSRKGVNFTSANSDFMRVSSGIVFSKYFTAVVLIKPATQSTSYAVILDQDHSTTGYQGWVIQRSGTSSFWQTWVANSSATNWTNANQIAYVDNTSQIVTLRKTSSTLALYSNGTSSGDVSIDDYFLPQAGLYGLNLGYWSAGGGRYYNGDICEILIYNRDLTTTELKQVHTYLGQKWGISNTDKSIADISGNNNIASFGGAAGSQTVGNMPAYDFYNKGALRFDGGDYALTATPVLNSPHTSPFTLEAFCCPSTVSVAYQTVLGTMSSFSQIGFVNDTFAAGRNGGGGGLLRNSLATVVANTWYHICMTYNGTNASFYLDGSFLSTQTIGTNNINNGVSLLGSYSSSSPSETFNGNIAAARIYNRELTATEVLQNYNAQKSRFTNTIVQQGLVLNLDAGNNYSYAGAGTTIYDVSPTALSWTINNATYNSSDPKYFSYNGSNSWLESSTSAAYDSQTITMECWCYPNSLNQLGFIFEKGAVNTQYSMFFENANFQFRTYGLSNQDVTITSTSFMTVNAWNHIVCTYASGTKITYVNGVQAGGLSGITGTLNTGGTNQYIGKYGNAGNNYQFNGRIAESRVYNIALSAAQVLQNYNATKGRFGL